jgi:hypothetical protein
VGKVYLISRRLPLVGGRRPASLFTNTSDERGRVKQKCHSQKEDSLGFDLDSSCACWRSLL